MQSYVAICGRQPEFSAAELSAKLPHADRSVQWANASVLTTDNEAIETLFPQLGGMVKLGRIVLTVSSVKELTTDRILQQLHTALAGEGKAIFGVSAYGSPVLQRAGAVLGKELKVFLASNGRPARFIVGERGVLSSVVVAKERLIEKGGELLLVERAQDILVARTVAVQAFEEFSQRDYGRPQRNQRSGMLPPKLARMMLNISGVQSSTRLLDPFCGSGTVIQEALLLGVQTITGADVTPAAVHETKENIAWLAKKEELPRHELKLIRSDIRELGKHVLPGSVDAIVTETLLGPPLRGGEDLSAIRSELEELYEHAFRVFHQLLAPQGVVTFAAPVFFVNEKPHFLLNLETLSQLGFSRVAPLPPSLKPHYRDLLSFRETLVYHRDGQRIGRELLQFLRK